MCFQWVRCHTLPWAMDRLRIRNAAAAVPATPGYSFFPQTLNHLIKIYFTCCWAIKNR